MAEKGLAEGQSKRDAILHAARALFARQGYEETTIADIARAAGVAVGTVYLYFRNKHEVYTGVALNIEAMVAEALQDPALLTLPFTQVPHAMVDALFHVSREHMHLMMLLQIDMHSSEEVLQHKHSHQQITEVLAAIFDRAVEQGELAPFNTEMYSQMLNLLGGALLHQCFAIEKGEREELYRTCLIEFIERLFFGPSLREGYPNTL